MAAPAAAYQVGPSSGSSSSSAGGFQYMNSNPHFGDTSLTKVFVGGLAWETQSETMRRYFEQFGEILEAVVITDKNTARSKGYGFVRPFNFVLHSFRFFSYNRNECLLTWQFCIYIGFVWRV